MSVNNREDVSFQRSPDWLPADTEIQAPVGRRQRIYASWLVDILVYVVVLNLYVEYSPAKVIDSFTISILTAVVLRALVLLVTSAKKWVWTWSKTKNSRFYTGLGVLGVWLILFLSKFVILETVNFMFGENVDLGSFIDVMLLVAGMVIALEVVHRSYRLLADR